MNDIFYELIRVSIGTQKQLSRTPDAQEWKILYRLAKKQALVGVCFVGLQKLISESNYSLSNLGINEKLYLTWMGMAATIQQRNELLNQRCLEIQKQFHNDGFQTCILKGQGAASYYSTNLKLLRQSGDIDIWVDGTWRTVMDYVNSRTPNREFDMKHTHLNVFQDTIVEVHWWPSMPVNPIYKNSLQEYYREQAPLQCNHYVLLPNNTGKITAPDAKFEAVHVLYHIFNHFLYEGIGLRQMMDLYFVLTNGNYSELERTELAETITRVGLAKFAPATMWVLEMVLGMKHEFALCEKDEELGKVLLAEIEEGGNFGHESKENQTANENYAQRMVRRLKRRIRLAKYNSIGLVCAPFTKVHILLWKRMVIKKYNL